MKELAGDICRVGACALMVVMFFGCGFDSRLVDFLDPPSPVNQPVAIIHTQILRDDTRGDIYVRLDGSSSYDHQQKPLTFQWELVERPVRSLAVIVSPTSMITMFDFDWNGCYTVTLVVTNSDGLISNAAITRMGVTDGPRGGAEPAPGDCAL